MVEPPLSSIVTKEVQLFLRHHGRQCHSVCIVHSILVRRRPSGTTIDGGIPQRAHSFHALRLKALVGGSTFSVCISALSVLSDGPVRATSVERASPILL